MVDAPFYGDTIKLEGSTDRRVGDYRILFTAGAGRMIRVIAIMRRTSTTY
jgi:hypothetical protein